MTNIPPKRFCRQASKNIIQNSSGVKHEYRNRLKIKSSWELFFSLDILTIIVDMTNKKISKVRNELPKNILDDNKYTFLHLTSAFEMLAVIGLIYLRGLLGLASHNIEIFNNLTGNPIFGATMSKNRFKFLFLTFLLMMRVIDQKGGNTIDLLLFAKFLKYLIIIVEGLLYQMTT